MQQQYLNAYDAQLRTTPEVSAASSTVEHGPLLLATFPDGRGFITYAELGDLDADGVALLVDAAIDHFGALPEVTSVEWKTRAHDRAPGLHDALVARGFVPEDPESIMIGEARLLAQHVDIPPQVTIRRSRSDDEVLAAGEVQGLVFDDPDWRARAESLIARLHEKASTELWVALVDDMVVSAGRLEPVADTEFAGLWGGATLPEWRGKGDLPCAHGRAGAVGPCPRHPVSPVGLHGVLPTDPGAVGVPEGVDDDALCVDQVIALTGADSSRRPRCRRGGIRWRYATHAQCPSFRGHQRV